MLRARLHRRTSMGLRIVRFKPVWGLIGTPAQQSFLSAMVQSRCRREVASIPSWGPDGTREMTPCTPAFAETKTARPGRDIGPRNLRQEFDRHPDRNGPVASAFYRFSHNRRMRRDVSFCFHFQLLPFFITLSFKVVTIIKLLLNLWNLLTIIRLVIFYYNLVFQII